jgi:hypothetical protein
MDEFEFTGDLNNVDYGVDVDMIDDTRFGAAVDTRVMAPGLVVPRLSFSGFTLSGVGEIETELAGVLGVDDRLLSIIPTGGAEGARVFPMFGSMANLKPFGGSVGDPNRIESGWQASASGVDNIPFLAGISLATGAKTSSDTGTGVQQGLVSAADTLYAWMHVTAVSGTNPTLDMIIESDDGAGFASAATRFTFAQATGITSEWMTPVVGPIADDAYWRANWTIGGTDTPTFTVLVGLAISGHAASI